MSNQAPDLGAYPVIRIDQIPLVSSDMLEKADRDVRELLYSLHEDASREGTPPPKLALYLQRQIDAMTQELARRAAGSRVDALLRGAAELFSEYNAGTTRSAAPLDGGTSLTSTILPKTLTRPERFKPLPLPSELNAIQPEQQKRSQSASSAPSEAGGAGSRAPSVSSAPRPQSGTSITSHTRSRRDSSSNDGPTLTDLTGEGGPDSAETELGARGGGSSIGGDVEVSDEVSQSTNLLSTRSDGDYPASQPQSRSRRRPPQPAQLSREAGTQDHLEENSWGRRPGDRNQPSKKALAAVFENFGSQFVVAATERRVRFIPKKKEALSVEEIRAKERLERWVICRTPNMVLGS